MEHNHEELQIDLREIFAYLKKKYWIILVTAVIAGFLGFLFAELFVTPQYTASTRIYILNRQDENAIYYADLQSSSQFIKDYTVLITGQNVTKTVVKKLDLNEGFERLASRISVTAPEDTRILDINISHEDPALAMNIANAVREEATKQIETIMAGNAVNLVYEADLPTSPSSLSSGRAALMGLVLGLVAAAGVLSVICVCDDAVRTEEDVEKYLSLSVLGVIPATNELRDPSGLTDKEFKRRLLDGKH